MTDHTDNLCVCVGALWGSFVLRLACRLGYFDLKRNRRLPRWIASGVVASLIFQAAVYRVLAGQDCFQRAHFHRNRKVAGIDVDLLVRSEGKGAVFAVGIGDLSNQNVSGSVEFEYRLFEILLMRNIGVDVIAVRHAKNQFDRAGVAASH